MCFLIEFIVFAILVLAAGLLVVAAVDAWQKLENFRARQGSRSGWPHRSDGRQVDAERDKLKLGILAMRIVVPTLGLVVLAMLLQTGLQLWRPAASSVAGAPEIEQLLRDRLPDSGALARQHEELIKAIQSVGRVEPSGDTVAAIQSQLNDLQSRIAKLEKDGPGAPLKPEIEARPNPAVSSLFSLASFFILLPLGACVLGIWAFLRILFASGAISAGVYRVATAATISAGSLLGGFTLKDVSIVKNAKSILTFEFKSDAPRPAEPQAVDFHLDLNVRSDGLSPARMDCGEGNSQRIGPFVDGTAKLKEEQNKVEQNRFDQIAREIAKVNSDARLTAVMLIGSADKRPLKPETAEKFSSNEGLARARVEAVRKLLDLDKLNVPVLVSFVGPSNTGSTVSVGDLEKDRMVQVCILRSPTVTSAGAQPLARPSVDTAPPQLPTPATLPTR